MPDAALAALSRSAGIVMQMSNRWSRVMGNWYAGAVDLENEGRAGWKGKAGAEEVSGGGCAASNCDSVRSPHLRTLALRPLEKTGGLVGGGARFFAC